MRTFELGHDYMFIAGNDYFLAKYEGRSGHGNIFRRRDGVRIAARTSCTHRMTASGLQPCEVATVSMMRDGEQFATEYEAVAN